MDFQTAFELSLHIQETQPELIVVGFRRMRPQAADSWAIDVMNGVTRTMATVDEKDLLETRLAEISGRR